MEKSLSASTVFSRHNGALFNIKNIMSVLKRDFTDFNGYKLKGNVRQLVAAGLFLLKSVMLKGLTACDIVGVFRDISR